MASYKKVEEMTEEELRAELTEIGPEREEEDTPRDEIVEALDNAFGDRYGNAWRLPVIGERLRAAKRFKPDTVQDIVAGLAIGMGSKETYQADPNRIADLILTRDFAAEYERANQRSYRNYRRGQLTKRLDELTTTQDAMAS
jgi:hypothetical protein